MKSDSFIEFEKKIIPVSTISLDSTCFSINSIVSLLHLAFPRVPVLLRFFSLHVCQLLQLYLRDKNESCFLQTSQSGIILYT